MAGGELGQLGQRAPNPAGAVGRGGLERARPRLTGTAGAIESLSATMTIFFQ